MADGSGGGFKPVINELSQDLVKPLVDEFGKQAEVIGNTAFGVKINPQAKSQNQDPKVEQKKQEDQQKIAILKWQLDKRAKLDEEMRQIRLKRKQEEEEKKKMDINKKQEEQQEEMQKQQESVSLNPNVRNEMTKSETGKGKGVGG